MHIENCKKMKSTIHPHEQRKNSATCLGTWWYVCVRFFVRGEYKETLRKKQSTKWKEEKNEWNGAQILYISYTKRQKALLPFEKNELHILKKYATE